MRPVEMTVRPFQEFAEQKVAGLGEQIDAYCDLSTSLALNDLQQPAEKRR